MSEKIDFSSLPVEFSNIPEDTLFRSRELLLFLFKAQNDGHERLQSTRFHRGPCGLNRQYIPEKLLEGNLVKELSKYKLLYEDREIFVLLEPGRWLAGWFEKRASRKARKGTGARYSEWLAKGEIRRRLNFHRRRLERKAGEIGLEQGDNRQEWRIRLDLLDEETLKRFESA